MASLIALLLFCNCIAIAAQVCLKIGVGKAGPAFRSLTSLWRAGLQPMVWAGGMLYAGGTVLWVRVLTTTDLSFAYPFAALGYAGGVLISQFLLRERVTTSRWVGLGLIAIGVLFVAASGAAR